MDDIFLLQKENSSVAFFNFFKLFFCYIREGISSLLYALNF